MLKCPLVGPAGREFARLLADAGLAPPLPHPYAGELDMVDWWPEVCADRGLFLTNTFAFRPANNSIPSLCCGKKDLPSDYTLPPIGQGKYIRPEFLGELDRLGEELAAVKPNLVVPLGGTACWAVLQSRAIGSLRGTVAPSIHPPGLKCLPANHPSAILYNWSMRPVLLADLMKAKRECEFPDIRRPRRLITVRPTLHEICAWAAQPADYYAVDIETFRGQISRIGFARNVADALVIPFHDPSKPDWSYWPAARDELLAWKFVQCLLERDTPKIFQNGLFDLQYILRMGLRPRNCLHDTMILHHARYP